MGWVKLDDGFFNNRKIVGVSRDAKLLYLAGLCYAGAALTDGAVPASALPILAAQTQVKATQRLAGELVSAGLWTRSGETYMIHDYLAHNTSATHVHAKRDAARERMQRVRSQDVRANKSRSSQNVREPETETETETETEEGGEPPNPPPDDSPPARSSRATRIPDDFAVTDELRSWTIGEGLGAHLVDFEAEKFVDHFRSASGATARKVDWIATWRNWIRRELRYQQRDGRQSQPRAPNGTHEPDMSPAAVLARNRAYIAAKAANGDQRAINRLAQLDAEDQMR